MVPAPATVPKWEGLGGAEEAQAAGGQTAGRGPVLASSVEGSLDRVALPCDFGENESSFAEGAGGGHRGQHRSVSKVHMYEHPGDRVTGPVWPEGLGDARPVDHGAHFGECGFGGFLCDLIPTVKQTPLCRRSYLRTSMKNFSSTSGLTVSRSSSAPSSVSAAPPSATVCGAGSKTTTQSYSPWGEFSAQWSG